MTCRKFFLLTFVFCAALACALTSCAREGKENAAAPPSAGAGVLALEDGVYSVDFESDGAMFHVNEVYGGKGTLTVSGGRGSVRLVMPSKNICALYLGKAADAKAEGAAVIEPTVETVEYPDGLAEEVYAFELPVPALDEEFDLALIGKKGRWYDHRARLANPARVPAPTLEPGEYRIPVALEGGSGRAKITTPAKVVYDGERYLVTVEWSSPNFDYARVGGEKYAPLPDRKNSTFELPFASLDAPVDAVFDSVAMSAPHEIEYTLIFDLSRLEPADGETQTHE